MTSLHEKKCVPCEGGVLPFTPEQVSEYLARVSGEWEAVENKKITRRFKFKNFKQAMDFVNKVADVAEEEGHHPDITINYNRVTLELTTHTIGGLSENDFIMAAKIGGLSVLTRD